MKLRLENQNYKSMSMHKNEQILSVQWVIKAKHLNHMQSFAQRSSQICTTLYLRNPNIVNVKNQEPNSQFQVVKTTTITSQG